MTKRRQLLGREGESRAARYLERQGYRIVARNDRAARVEIDLIARRGSLLVFVEVKSRRAAQTSANAPDPTGHGQAAEAVDARKQARLRRGAMAWLDEHPAERSRARRLRFDVVTCLRFESETHRPSSAGPGTRPSHPQNETTAPVGARWSIEHWQGAF
jgi:putative endonuclease